ncbi:MAG: class I SAM-dependent methyltransferase [Bacteroidetes bacterium]|nr:class I SAM-dependent methyltransferase [Bacteroidota bacterium]
MNNTKTSFADKWNNNPDLAFTETLRVGSDIYNWILTRNGFKNSEELSSFLSAKSRILDAGCGNGRVTALLRKYSNQSANVVGIDLVAHEVAKKNLEGAVNTNFFQKDLLSDLSDLGKFDFIYCQEVLHHTNNPKAAFLNLVTLLDNKGEIAIYVYKKKAPVREFVDDFIREKIAPLNYEEAMKVCEQITQLGKTLSEIKGKVVIPQVDVLEIKGGEYDIQRFLYHFFMKCFWNPDLSMEQNVAINYDWYHPQNCTRHTMAEILDWYKEAGLNVSHQFEDFYGITVRGSK